MESNLFLGKLGENIAVRYFIKNGYLIPFRNVKSGSYEIDIIAKDRNGVLIFCEVKTRRLVEYSSFSPEDSISRRKLARMIRAAQFFEGNFPWLISSGGWRIDLLAITIAPGREKFNLRHYKNV